MIQRDIERYKGRVRISFQGYDTLFPLPPDERIPISSMEEFQLIGTEFPSNGNFVLTRNIDAAGYEGYEPVSLSNARFDGQGHSISNLYLDRTVFSGDDYYSGLFKELNYSLVKNLTLLYPDMTGLITGALAATGNGTSLVNCHVKHANIFGSYASAFIALGALCNVVKCSVDNIAVYGNRAAGIGMLSESSHLIDTHVYSGTISGIEGYGGLIGQLDKGGLVESCSVNCVLRFFEEMGDPVDFLAAGGIAAVSLSDGTFINCSSDCTFENLPETGFSGSLIGAINSGTQVQDCLGVAHGAAIGLIGYDDGFNDVTESYWDITTSDQTSSAAGTGKTTLELQDCSTYGTWDLDVSWSCVDGAYPELNELTGTINYFDPSDIEIGTVADFQKIGVEETHPVFRKYVLISDLDLTGVTWTPIDLYNGSFNGAGHSVSNLTIDTPDADEVGLFRRVNEIKSLTLIDATVTGRSSVGCFMGTGGAASGNIFDCTGLNCEVYGQSYTGLLAGVSDYIDYCKGEGVIHAYGMYLTYFGGIAGVAQNIRYSGFIGEFDTSGASFVAGLIGVGAVTRSYAECDVVGQMNVGGLIGQGCQVSDSRHEGSVIGHTNVGGLIGGNHQYCTYRIYRSYQSGDVIGQASVGPIVGYRYPAFITRIEQTYYNSDYNVMGTEKDEEKPLSTLEMTCPSTSFEGFDFATVWDCIEGQSPKHKTSIMTAPTDAPENYLLYAVNDGQQFIDFDLPYGNDWQFENVYIAFAEELVNAEEAWLAMYVNGGKIIKIQDISTQEAFIQNEIPMQAGDRIVPVVTGENGSEYRGPYYEGYITFRKI